MSQTLTAAGMSCEGCEDAVENALAEVQGVSAVEADNETDSVTVEGIADTDDLEKAVEVAGYEVS